MAKPNYQFEKRQRDLAKKSKREEKLRQKQQAKGGAEGVDGSVADAEVNPSATESSPQA